MCTFLIEYTAWFTGTTITITITIITTTTTTTSIFQNCIWLFSCDYIVFYYYLNNKKINIQEALEDIQVSRLLMCQNIYWISTQRSLYFQLHVDPFDSLDTTWLWVVLLMLQRNKLLPYSWCKCSWTNKQVVTRDIPEGKELQTGAPKLLEDSLFYLLRHKQ